MKQKILTGLMVAMISVSVLAGCGSGGSDTQSAAGEAVSATASSAAADASEASSVDASSQAELTDSAETEPAAEDEAGSSEAASAAADTSGDQTAEASAPIEDGVYLAEFDTDNSMFHVNEANDGKGILTVQDGQMTIHVSLASKNIVNLYPGLKADAQKEGAELLQPTTDSVTYSDGMTEEVYGFDIPVPALDEEFDCALIGTKGKWYDHKVVVSNPEPYEEAE